MGKTKIDWCDYSWNPWRGCTPIRAGCKNCYMFKEQRRYGRDPEEIVRAAPATFNAPLAKLRDGSWKWPDGSRVFLGSWMDYCHEGGDPYRQYVNEIIRQRTGLIFIILTKRPERLPACLPSDWGAGYPNVRIGVSVSTQQDVDDLVPLLLDIPAQCRIVSAEPLIEELDLRQWLGNDWVSWSDYEGPDHVIAGCESASATTPGRPADLEWFRSLRDQCQEAGVPYFLKQIAVDGRLVKMPELDGRVWDEEPRP